MKQIALQVMNLDAKTIGAVFFIGLLILLVIAAIQIAIKWKFYEDDDDHNQWPADHQRRKGIPDNGPGRTPEEARNIAIVHYGGGGGVGLKPTGGWGGSGKLPLPDHITTKVSPPDTLGGEPVKVEIKRIHTVGDKIGDTTTVTSPTADPDNPREITVTNNGSEPVIVKAPVPDQGPERKESLTTTEILQQGETLKAKYKQTSSPGDMVVEQHKEGAAQEVAELVRSETHSAYVTKRGNYVTITGYKGDMAIVEEPLTGKKYWHKQETLRPLTAHQRASLETLLEKKRTADKIIDALEAGDKLLNAFDISKKTAVPS